MVIFISRNLKEDSSFLHQLEGQGHEVIGESLLQFQALPFSTPEPVDWIFAYSPRGIRFFLEGLAKNSAPLPQSQAFAAIGPGTAHAMKELGVSPTFIGNGNPEDTAKNFAAKASGQRVLFPQAKDSRRSVEGFLGNQIQAVPLSVYESVPRIEFSIPTAQTLVFTSPRNAQVYFEKYRLEAGQSVIAIGKTTAHALRTLGLSQIHIAAHPNEEELLKTVQAVMNRKS